MGRAGLGNKRCGEGRVGVVESRWTWRLRSDGCGTRMGNVVLAASVEPGAKGYMGCGTPLEYSCASVCRSGAWRASSSTHGAERAAGFSFHNGFGSNYGGRRG